MHKNYLVKLPFNLFPLVGSPGRYIIDQYYQLGVGIFFSSVLCFVFLFRFMLKYKVKVWRLFALKKLTPPSPLKEISSILEK